MAVGCRRHGSEEMIEKGSKVKIHYKLTVEGEVVDSSEGKPPLEFVQGEGQIISGLEEELEGLKTGDQKEVVVSPQKGYGPSNPEAFQKVPKQAFQGNAELKEGEWVMGNAGGREFRAKISEINDDSVTLDLNHPLAGKSLEFSIEVVEVA
jgi:FKBP-type peptidyl-prolyl cis-trans isomerase SlyD